MQGFKSFANKTEIEFEKDITAIVGPNGSGKSNISDAIRWVLGEQSIKNLRGNKMEDVIFSGTNQRRALGFAEVSMHFDNKDRHIPIDYNEVAVTRRMFRSGESEFYINKSPCRLKDIRELFMDTGIGKDGYSIIGQGRIDEILSNRPEDRRSIFEEAAGIVKYKNKKQDGERKLLNVEDNIIRIKDVLSEISHQEKGLAIEANKARKFTALYDELKSLEVNLYIKDINELNIKIHDIKMKMKKSLQEIEDMKDLEIKMKSKFKVFNEEIDKKNEKIEIAKAKQSKIIKNIEKNRNQIKILEEQNRHRKEDQNRINEEIKNLKELISRIDKKNGDLNLEYNLIEKDYNNIYKDFKFENKKLLDINNNIDDKEEQLEVEKGKTIEIHNNISHLKNQLENIKSFDKNIYIRLEKLKKNIDLLKRDKESINENIESLLSKKKEIQKSLEVLKMDRKKYNLKEEENKKTLDDISRDVKSKEIELEGITSNYKLYQNMEEYYEGYYKGVKNFLNAIQNSHISDKGYIGLVVNLLKVERKYEKAIEVSLGSRLQNVVLEKEHDAKDMIHFLKSNNKGRVTFLPLNVVKGNPVNIDIKSLKGNGVLGLGHDLIEYDNKYKNLFEYLLGRTIIVDNIDNGIKLANKFNHRYRIVTLNGDILNPGGALTGGSYNNNFSLIRRKNKIKQLKNKISFYKKEISRLEEEKRLSLNRYNDNNKKRMWINKKINNKELKFIELNNQENNSIKELDRLDKEIENTMSEMKSLEEETKEFKGKKSSYIQKLKELKIKSEKFDQTVKNLNEELAEDKKNKDEIYDEVTNYKIELNNLKNMMGNINNNIKNNEQEKRNSNCNLNNQKEALKSIYNDIQTILQRKNNLSKEIKNKKVLEISLAKDIEKINIEKEHNIDQSKKIEDKIKEINKTLLLTEKNKNQYDLMLSKYELQYENKNRRIFEDYELNYDSALELESESINLKNAKQQISKLKKSIKRLGNVNLSSLEDYKTVKERLDFLEEQLMDLTNSKENLNILIKDMERVMRKEFKESFKKINQNFSKIFSILFDGGVATLELDNDSDILEAGINIKVQPPGKKLQNISLLSGGEKSLTAVALLFAILEFKPSPFCILDEIDASLDEANINKYTSYLKEINKNTQFILITHQKTTMEIANVLYGVTMAEKGISRLISVKLEDYIDNLVS